MSCIKTEIAKLKVAYELATQTIADLSIKSAQQLELLVRIAQIFDGWHQDGTAWTEWDESVRREMSAMLAQAEVKK